MADNLNIKNPSVTQGELDLRTDASGNIVSISGHSIAGGAGGGNVYFGDDEYIKFKTGTTNTFTLTDGVKDTIDHIPQIVSTEVSRISYTKDSIDDKLDEKQNKLTFEYDEDNKVSAINGSALAGQGGTTYTPGQYINIDSNNEISVTGVVASDEYATYSGDWNDVSNSYKTNSGSFITKDVNDLTNYYPKTQTSSDNELAEAFGSILKYDVTAAAGIKITTATDVGIKTFGISMTAEPVVTDTRLSGYNGIAAEPDGNVSGLWDVGLTQDMLNKINGKLDSTAAAQTYLEKSTYTNASGKWENASNVVVTNSADWNAKVDQDDLNDYLTKEQYGTDSATFALKNDLYEYYTKTDTSSKDELSTEFAKYQVTGDYVTESEISDMATKTWVGEQGFYTKASGDNDYAPKSVTATINTLTGASAGWNEVTSKLDKSIYSNASGNWENTYNVVNQYSAAGTWLTAHQPLTNYYTKSDTSSKLELSTEFAKYVTSSNVTTQDTDYVMTTTGWKVLTLPGGGMTQVIHDETLTGQGNDANSKLSVAWSALSGNTINSAKSAGSATSADKAESAVSAKWLREGDAHVSAGDVTALQHWASSNSSTWNEVSAKLGTAQYALDSGTFVTSSNSTITGTKQYALTTAGWSDIGLSNYLPLSGGTVTGDVVVSSNGSCLLAVGTEATLMGQSRVVNLGDTTARGTNWLGVTQSNQGFLKYVNGGNVGALNGTSIQINFAPDGANSYGSITVNSQDNMSKVINVPTASYNSMSSFDNTNGPNYMLRKTASGFDIGAAVINVTQLPATTEANAYYFVYDA